MLKYLLPITIVILLFSSCKKKEPAEMSLNTMDVGEDITLFKARFLNDSVGFACGGERDQFGHIYKTTDGGQIWKKTVIEFSKCIYDVYFLNDSVGYAGGDFLYLYKTKDGGDNWYIPWWKEGELPQHEIDRPAIKRFEFLNDSAGYFVAGHNYNAGVIYQTIDGGKNWAYEIFPNELKGLSISTNNEVYFSGYGYVGKTCNGNLDCNQIDLKGDFYVAVETFSDNSILLAGNNGGIYKSTDNGNSWGEKISPNKNFNKRVAFNDMKFHKNIGYAVGNYGFIMKSTDRGETWTDYSLGNELHLYSITYSNNKFYISSEEGKIFIIQN